MSETIQQLGDMVLQFRDERDWKKFHSFKDMVLSLFLETAELAEHFQWKTSEEAVEHVRQRKAEIGEELADVLYWVLLLSREMDLDLGQAFLDKMQKNREKYPVEMAKGRHTKYTELPRPQREKE